LPSRSPKRLLGDLRASAILTLGWGEHLQAGLSPGW